jgi:uncharacterized protein YndB with AHSA1/START domain
MAQAEPPSGLRLRLVKVIAASPDRVFAEFVDGRQLRRWWGPSGFTVPRLEFDAVEGANYRLVMQPPEGDVFHIRGTFLTVEPPRRLTFSFVYEEPDPDDQETVVTLTFEPTDEGSRIVLEQGPFKTEARLELHRQGWAETLDRLEQLIL